MSLTECLDTAKRSSYLKVRFESLVVDTTLTVPSIVDSSLVPGGLVQASPTGQLLNIPELTYLNGLQLSGAGTISYFDGSLESRNAKVNSSFQVVGNSNLGPVSAASLQVNGTVLSLLDDQDVSATFSGSLILTPVPIVIKRLRIDGIVHHYIPRKIIPLSNLNPSGGLLELYVPSVGFPPSGVVASPFFFADTLIRSSIVLFIADHFLFRHDLNFGIFPSPSTELDVLPTCISFAY